LDRLRLLWCHSGLWLLLRLLLMASLRGLLRKRLLNLWHRCLLSFALEQPRKMTDKTIKQAAR
jgi:hypothetical protein